MSEPRPIVELKTITKSYGNNDALSGVDLQLFPGEVHCLLGDNGAGKSSLIKVMAGVTTPTSGDVLFKGDQTRFTSPRAALSKGIATVHQDVGSIPLLSVTRNFFLGQEPSRGWGPFRTFDEAAAGQIAVDEIKKMGVRRVDDPQQLVGTLSGGERQALAIARALFFGASVLVLDEPTAALGVRESGIVIDAIKSARDRGIALCFITHNARHAYEVGDRFTVLWHGRVAASLTRGSADIETLTQLMAGVMPSTAEG